ncbi:MAG: hypothetical protein ABR973_04065 [Candidatus Acidiferrales bacterium]|jgi:TolA-binding protein
MKHRTLAFLSALILCATVAVPSRAQSSSAGSSETSEPAAEPSSQASSTAPAQPTSKKVWTNDDVSGLRDGSAISTFTEPNAKPAKTGAKPASKGRDAKWYQDQITKLQAQIRPLDTQIAQLQAAIEGKPTGNSKESTRPYGVKADQWPVELDQLQKKRGDIEAHISALEDEARHNGVPPNALP